MEKIAVIILAMVVVLTGCSSAGQKDKTSQ